MPLRLRTCGVVRSQGRAVSLCSHLPADKSNPSQAPFPSLSLFFKYRENKHRLNFRLDCTSEGRASCSFHLSFPQPRVLQHPRVLGGGCWTD